MHVSVYMITAGTLNGAYCLLKILPPLLYICTFFTTSLSVSCHPVPVQYTYWDFYRVSIMFSLGNAKRSFSSVIQQCFWKSWSNCSNEVIVLLVNILLLNISLSCFTDWRPLLCTSINISPFPLTMSLTAHVGKFSIPDHKRLLMLLGMFNCIQAEQTIAIRKRKFLYKFSVINNALSHIRCQCYKTELESCCTDV